MAQRSGRHRQVCSCFEAGQHGRQPAAQVADNDRQLWLMGWLVWQHLDSHLPTWISPIVPTSHEIPTKQSSINQSPTWISSIVPISRESALPRARLSGKAAVLKLAMWDTWRNVEELEGTAIC